MRVLQQHHNDGWNCGLLAILFLMELLSRLRRLALTASADSEDYVSFLEHAVQSPIFDLSLNFIPSATSEDLAVVRMAMLMQLFRDKDCNFVGGRVLPCGCDPAMVIAKGLAVSPCLCACVAFSCH